MFPILKQVITNGKIKSQHEVEKYKPKEFKEVHDNIQQTAVVKKKNPKCKNTVVCSLLQLLAVALHIIPIN